MEKNTIFKLDIKQVQMGDIKEKLPNLGIMLFY